MPACTLFLCFARVSYFLSVFFLLQIVVAVVVVVVVVVVLTQLA